MAKQVITARLGRRQAYWNPGVPGFDGLNGIGPDSPIEVTVDAEKNPELYKSVLHAISLGVLVVPLAENDVKPTKQTTNTEEGSTEKSTKDDMPSLDKTAKTYLASLQTDELVTVIDKIQEVGLLSTMMEYELNGENRMGKPRDKVKTAIRSRIKAIEQPNE